MIDAIGAIQLAVKFTENAPVLINAANHIVVNGIKPGGYEVLTKAWQGIAQNGGSLTSVKDIGTSAIQGLQGFQGSGNLTKDIMTLGNNVKSRFVAPKLAPTTPQLDVNDAFRATDNLNHAITESASGLSSVLGSVGSATAKGGIAGIALGITTETLASYKRYKDGEITKEEYITEIAKSGGQMGITGAATSGIMTAISVPLTAAELAAAPVTVPISIILGAGIDKIVAPAFGRGDYKKILGEAKYYQNMLYAHDDLVHAIEMTENQFVEFINEYARQMQVHSQLTDTNRQLKQLHTVADIQIQQQANQINSTFSSLGDLFNKI